MATSPQSTLCGFGSWSFSSNGASPEGPSLVPSPPSTPYPPQRDEALDLLYAAAGRVARLGLNDGSFNGRGLLQPPSAATLKMSARAFIQQQLQAARVSIIEILLFQSFVSFIPIVERYFCFYF